MRKYQNLFWAQLVDSQSIFVVSLPFVHSILINVVNFACTKVRLECEPCMTNDDIALTSITEN